MSATDSSIAEVVVVEHSQKRWGTDMGGGEDARQLMKNISSISFSGQISSFYFVSIKPTFPLSQRIGTFPLPSRPPSPG